MTTKKKKNLKSAHHLQPLYKNLIIIFSFLAVILIGAILYFALSQANIEIKPVKKEQTVGFAVQVVDESKARSADLNNEKIPGKITETAVEETKIFPAKTYEESLDKASGSVTIINNSSRNQKLIATTRLLTADNKLYRLEEFVEVPAGGKVETIATADQSGEQYEIGSAKLTIPGLWEPLQTQIYAETEGFKKQTLTKYIIDQPTIDAAKETLKQELISQAKTQLEQQLAEGETINEQSIVPEIIKYSTDAEVNSTAKEFSTTLNLGIQAVIFDEQQLKQSVIDNLPVFYTNDNAMVEVDQNSFTYEASLLDENSENLISQIKGEYKITVVNLDVDKGELTGLSKSEAANYLKSLSGVKEVKISLPFWTKFLPPLPDKINIKIVE